MHIFNAGGSARWGPVPFMKKLTELGQGVEGIVVKTKLDEGEENRLADLGLRRGSTVKVLYGGTDESILIAVGDGHIGVNYDVANKIYVH